MAKYSATASSDSARLMSSTSFSHESLREAERAWVTRPSAGRRGERRMMSLTMVGEVRQFDSSFYKPQINDIIMVLPLRQ